VSSADDAALIAASQRGDRSAFDELIRRHQHRAYQYAFRLTSNPDEAADLVSDAFLRVHHALGNFRGQSAFTTWLYRIVTNCYLDLRKRERTRQHLSLDAPVGRDGEDVGREVVDVSEGPGAHAERDERERLMRQAVAKLPAYQQAMLTLFHVENLSYEEIAQSLDLPIGTVKSRLNRARLSLRELLVPDAELFEVR